MAGSSSSAAVKEGKTKMAALLKLQNTNGSFELTEAFCGVIGLPLKPLKKEMEEKRFDSKAWATALAMEFIDVKLPKLKPDFVKEFDKAKLFVFKVWADSQPFLKKAAMAQLSGAAVADKGVDGDGRPIV